MHKRFPDANAPKQARFNGIQRIEEKVSIKGAWCGEVCRFTGQMSTIRYATRLSIVHSTTKRGSDGQGMAKAGTELFEFGYQGHIRQGGRITLFPSAATPEFMIVEMWRE